MCAQQHRHLEIQQAPKNAAAGRAASRIREPLVRALCAPSSAGTQKFNRTACSDPVQIWLVSGVNLEASWSQHDPALDPALAGFP